MKKSTRKNTQKNVSKAASKAANKAAQKKLARQKAAAKKVERNKSLAQKNQEIISNKVVPAQSPVEETLSAPAEDLEPAQEPSEKQGEKQSEKPSAKPSIPTTSVAKDKDKEPKPKKSDAFYNKKTFYVYLSIVFCMLIMESHRFALYFEDESNKYPIFSHVSEGIKVAGDVTGINTLMQSVGDFISELSEEQVYEVDKPFGEQWDAMLTRYKDIVGLSPAPEKELAKKEEKAKPEKPLAKKETSPQEKTKQESEIQAEKKQEEKPEVEEVKPVHYAFYDPQNIVAAPTKMALDEYITKLPDLGKKKKILLVGDSMMQGLVPLIQTALKHRKDLEIVHRVKVSTGLTNQRFFHWPDNLKKLLKQHDPDIVIVFIGANDPQDLFVQKKWYKVSSDSWAQLYSMRTINFLELATSENRKVVWIGLPIMLKEPYAKNIKRINAVFKEATSFYPASAFVDTQMLLTDNGKFISFLPGKNNKTVRVRAKDNIHLTFAGGRVITNHMIPTLNERVGAARLDDVDGNPLIPVAGKANRITFTSQIQNKSVEYIAYLPNPQLPPAPKPVAASNPKEAKKQNAEWSPLISTAQATALAPQVAPLNILAIQKNADEPLAVEKLIEESLQSPIPAQKSQKAKSKKQSFPVLYLLHGAAGNGHNWNEHMGKELQKIADEKRVIIVAPTSQEYSWYVNSPLQKNSQIESFIVKELVPHVDALLPTNGKRAIAGLSMGGHGALLISLKHPKTFPSAASASGVLDIRLHPEQWGINKVLGNYASNKNNWNKNSVAYVLERKNSKNIPKQILITTGLQDHAVLEDNQKVKKLLEKKKFKFEYEEAQGNHDWQFWSEQFAKLLRKQADFLNL